MLKVDLNSKGLSPSIILRPHITTPIHNGGYCEINEFNLTAQLAIKIVQQ